MTAPGPGAAPKLFIATPTADGIALAGYVAALAALLTDLHARGVATEYRTLDGDDLVTQRDRLTHDFLASDATHLLFIDSDMAFPADLAARLLAAGKPLIGAVGTRRMLDLKRLSRLAPERGFDDALALSYDWCFRPLGGSLTVRQGLAKVEGVGGAFLLIRRDCLDTLIARGEAPTYRHPDSPVELRAIFRELREGERVLDLDYGFCRRWILAGGEVFAYVDADLRHIGDWRHGVPFTTHLKSLAARPDEDARAG